MRNLAMRLWQDDAGFVVSTELVLIATIIVLGALVGQATLRDAVISELADTAESINELNQSYSFSTVTGHSSSVTGTVFTDQADFCEDEGQDGRQGVTGNGHCVNLNATVVTQNG